MTLSLKKNLPIMENLMNTTSKLVWHRMTAWYAEQSQHRPWPDVRCQGRRGRRILDKGKKETFPLAFGLNYYDAPFMADYLVPLLGCFLEYPVSLVLYHKFPPENNHGLHIPTLCDLSSF